MAKPLRSENPNPAPVQFSHFGVLNDGERSKAATITSISINVGLAAIILILCAVVKNNPVIAKKVADLTLPPQPKPDPVIEAELKRNFQLAGQLGATGTPLFVIGDRVMNGAVGYDMLKDAIAKARSKG